MTIRDEFITEGSVVIPVTFDYKGGRSSNGRFKVILSILGGLFFVVSVVVILASKDFSFLYKLFYIAVSFTVTSLVVRFSILREKVYKKRILSCREAEKRDITNTYWGIYKIDNDYPYICHYIDGKRGIFISLHKDVFVGKGSNIFTQHNDAVANAYNVASRLKVDLVGIDYMDSTGNDQRIDVLYKELSKNSNEKMKYNIGLLYRNILDTVKDEFASYDVYCITTGSKGIDLSKAMSSIVSELLEGNYIAYKALNKYEIKQLCSTIIPNKQFSLVDACNNTLNVHSTGNFKPLFLIEEDGTKIDLQTGDAESTQSVDVSNMTNVSNKDVNTNKTSEEVVDLF